MPKSLKDKKYYRYAGKCRHCGRREEWVVDRSGMDYASFYRVTRDNHFPAFICHCEGCGNQAVFDLTAISAS